MDSKYYETFDLLKSAIPLVFLRLSVCYTIYTYEYEAARHLKMKLTALSAIFMHALRPQGPPHPSNVKINDWTTKEKNEKFKIATRRKMALI